MITLTLLHPHQSIALKRWTFEHETLVRVGRAPDNDVILYSAVVSRHHLELRYDNQQWTMVNLGTNGTYSDDKPITAASIVDGAIVRLARTGPQIQLHVTTPPPLSPAQQLLHKLLDKPTIEDEETTNDLPLPGKTRVIQDPPATKVPPENLSE
ncbi:MAG: FHA domain-containing protein [Cyanobacteria bacterium SID2]|nr:FHA domain-containing protein [Cyanobacteria bacterium SID2]MBP0006700.1 FHA domain-containing protein [Cyanobacteria bacterium SBC]